MPTPVRRPRCLPVALAALFALAPGPARPAAPPERLRAEAAQERAERALYLLHVQQARQEWEANDVGRARQLLDRCPAGLRGWEWHHLRRRLEADLTLHRRHGGSVLGVAFSRKGDRLASVGLDGVVKVHDARTGRALLTLRHPTLAAAQVAFSPDGTRIATAAYPFLFGFRAPPGPGPGGVRVWDAATGAALLTLPQKSPVTCVTFTPDGKRIVSGGAGNTVTVWDADSGRPLVILRGHKAPVLSMAVSGDGSRIVSSGRDGTVRISDALTGRPLLTIHAPSPYHSRLALSPDGTRLALARGRGTVGVWDARTGVLLHELRGHTGPVRGVAFSPDGKRLASAGADRAIKVWDAATGTELVTLRGHADAVNAVAFSPDGQRLASCGGSVTREVFTGNPAAVAGEIKVWDVTRAPGARSLVAHKGDVTRALFSPDGSRLLSTYRLNEARIVDVRTGKDVFTLTGPVTAAAFSADGRHLVLGAARLVRVCSADTGKELRAFAEHRDNVSAVAVSPDGKWAASGDRQGNVKVWELATGKEARAFNADRPFGFRVAPPKDRAARRKGHAGPIAGLAFSPDGKVLVSASWAEVANSGAQDEWTTTTVPGDVRLWGLEAGKELPAPEGQDRAVEVVVSSVGDDLIRGWPRSPFTINAVALSPDGRLLAAAGSDGKVRLWDVRTGKRAHTLAATAESVAFSPDGRRLASAGPEALRLWDVRSGLEAFAIRGPCAAVAFSPDGGLLAVAAGNEVKLHDGTPLPAEAQAERRALAEVAALLDRGLLPEEAVARLKADRSLDDTTRRVALRLAEDSAPNVRALIAASWEVVQRPGAGPDDYRRALARAEAADRLIPGQNALLSTLGVAQYRAGKFREAIATLRRADELYRANRARAGDPGPSRPADRAFLAMAHGQLGQVRQVAWYLSELRGQVLGPHEAGYRREAEAVVRRTTGLLLLGPVGGGHGLAFSPDSKRLAVGADWALAADVWDVATGERAHTLSVPVGGRTGGAAFSPDGKQIAWATADGLVRRWDVAGGMQLAPLKGPAVNGLAYSPDGKRLAVATSYRDGGKTRGEVKLLDSGSGKEAGSLKGQGKVLAVAFRRDGKRLASAGEDGTIKVWDVDGGAAVHTLRGHDGAVTAVAFAADGRLLSGGKDKTVKVWDVAAEKVLHTFRKHKEAVGSVAWHPDGARVASGSVDQVVIVWEARTGKALRTLLPEPPPAGFKAHLSPVGVCFSPDGRWLASGGGFRRLTEVWEVARLLPAAKEKAP